MNDSTPSPGLRPASLFTAAIGLAGAAASAWAWKTSGQFSHLVVAAGFAAMTPVWCLRPFSLVSPSPEEAARRRQPLPGWVSACSMIGMALLFGGILYRWLM